MVFYWDKAKCRLCCADLPEPHLWILSYSYPCCDLLWYLIIIQPIFAPVQCYVGRKDVDRLASPLILLCTD